MTTTNVTDATLKGKVTGPTFTGDVDGAKFTGSVTYTDTTTPPVEPPPVEATGPTGGLITVFNGNQYETSTIDGIDYSSQTYGGNWSANKIDDHTIRYEIRQGDHPNWSADANVSELQCYKENPTNTAVTIAYRIMLEPGSSNTASWMLAGIEYQDKPASSKGASPVVAIELSGEKWSILHRWCRVGGDPSNNPGSDMKQLRWTASNNLERGKWYVFEIEAKPNQTSGYLRVKIDGQQVVNYSGPLGFGGVNYMLFGLYREARPEVLAAKIKNMTVSWTK